MKGTIVKCLEGMVQSRFGDEKWKQILVKAGKPAVQRFTALEVVPDGEVMKLIDASCSVLGIAAAQAFDAFGEFWSTKYAPEIYGVYFEKAKNAREFILNLDHVHTVMTRTSGAQPPHFTYTWKSDRELVIGYNSPRNLVALMPGLLRGVAKYYRERLDVSVVGNDVTVRFAA